MKEQLHWARLGILLMLALAACGQVPEPPAATLVPAPDWPAEAQPMVDLVLADLARESKESTADAEVVEVVAVEWPDGCLGCAKKGEMCTQALVPGYRIVVRLSDDSYEYRTDKEQVVRRCDGAEEPVGDWGEATPLVRQAITDVTGLLSVPASEVKVVAVEEKEWNDSSLGCPEPGKAYLTVITPGYQIILEVQGQRYDYRASRTAVRLCKGATQ